MKAETYIWIDILCVCISATKPVLYSFVYVQGVSAAIKGTNPTTKFRSKYELIHYLSVLVLDG